MPDNFWVFTCVNCFKTHHKLWLLIFGTILIYFYARLPNFKDTDNSVLSWNIAKYEVGLERLAEHKDCKQEEELTLHCTFFFIAET